ncbi:hypothetical protein B6U74_03425 [Candidatus Bathyarchaeota archaeon ex4484_205]|nr:MAG: hypothetical protein B6U74_03425 [Candidatus Bathyarchaeota archaeon ex4484_205]RLG66443.1 MAG: hypothetical protein DRN93_06310 [archaeon]
MSRRIDMETKMRRAAQLLFYKHHREPGVKGWELRRSLGRGYLKAVKALDTYIQPIGLRVRIIGKEGEEIGWDVDEDSLSSARFYVVLREPLRLYDVSTAGWSIDDVAGLTIVLATIISRRGKVDRKKVEELLKEKFPEWKVETYIERYKRRGYIEEENGVLTLGWRTYAEVDIEKFLHYVVGAPTEEL